MESNTRKLIGEIQDEVFKSSELTPNRAAEILTMTSALLGNINDKIVLYILYFLNIKGYSG